MKVILILSLLFLLGWRSTAQEIFHSSNIRVNKKEVFDLVGVYQGGYMSTKFNGKQCTWNIYKDNLVLNKELKLDYSEDGVEWMQTIILKDTLLNVYSSVINNDKKIMVHGLNEKSVSKAGKKNVLNQKDYRKNEAERTMLIVSKNRSIIAFLQREEIDRESYQIYFSIYDSELNLLGKSALTFEHPLEDARLKDFVLDNDGNLSLLIQNRNMDIEREDASYYQYELWNYDIENKKIDKNKIENDSLFFTGLMLEIDEVNDACVLIGYYSESSFSVIEGNFVERYKLGTDTIITRQFNKFDDNLLIKLAFNKVKSEKEDINDFVIKKVILKSDGGALLIGESFYTTMVSYTAPNLYNSYSMNNVTNYHYNDILITSIDKEGKVNWNKIIRKKQVVEDIDRHFASFKWAVFKNRIVILFNDDVSKRNKVKQYMLSKDGELMESEISNELYDIESIKQVSPTELLLISGNNGEYRISKIQY